ncbi:NlpC/P60 family protein [Pseudovibrio sp. Tun.PSC04-5.I4]|uniref:NlpC/P60 family protein n=1 Tax=Pseudovibrio sp. Tun.PSC04-5.I4 TaxID=1798213 RepID=UPI0008891282|nr:NlpC/P60 family protein [Pseudovibrio sp. Tun.PSC04-5.I4]SDR39840.1 putative phage cell wall peptidase, NlpC/P60 family [Pseudovibrio sp. Tun.PSC04-5.I4]
MTEDQAQQIITAARSWIGTPYHDQAGVRGVGCDCLGLIRGVWREVIGDEPTDIPPYTRDWGETGGIEVLAEGAKKWLQPVPLEHIKPGCILMFRMRDTAIAKHCGIMSDANHFIHAYERVGVIEQQLTKAWRLRLAFGFSLIGTSQLRGTNYGAKRINMRP